MNKEFAFRYLGTVGCAEVHNKPENLYEYWFCRNGKWSQDWRFENGEITTEQLAEHMVHVEAKSCQRL